AGVVGEVAGGPAQDPLDAVAEVSVAAVQHGGEQVGEQLDDVGGNALGRQGRGVVGRRYRRVTDGAAGGGGDLGDRVGEGEQPRAGPLIDLPGVTLLGRRRGPHLRHRIPPP